MKNRKQLFLTSRLLLMIVAVALVLSMGLTACGLPSGTPDDKAPNDVALDAESVESSDEATAAQSFTSTSKVNLEETYGELLPLYETLTEQEDTSYSLVFDIAGGIDLAGVSGAVDWKFVANIYEGVASELMLLDEQDRVLISYKDGKINLDGFGMDVTCYQGIINSDMSKLFAEDATAAIAGALVYLNDFLSDYDALAQVVPAVFNSMNFDTTGLVMTSQDGEYVFNANCQPLLILASTYLSDSFDDLLAELPFEIDIAQLLGVENTEASDLELLITAVDDMFFDGALMNGYVDLCINLNIEDNGLNGSVALVSAANHNQKYLYLELGGYTEDEISYVVPEITEFHDIQADIPISLPQNGIYLTIHTVIHTADSFGERGHDLVTATVDLNGMEDVVRLVLNDSYFFVDINELVMIANPLIGETTDYTYILPLGEGVGLGSMLKDLFLEYDCLDVDFDPDCFYPGMTEEALREILYVAPIYLGYKPEEVFDYEIKSFCKCPYDDCWWISLYYNEHHAYTEHFSVGYVTHDETIKMGDFRFNYNIDDLYPEMTEAELREVMDVWFTEHIPVYDENGLQIGTVTQTNKIYDYFIDDMHVCPYCGLMYVEISYMGCYKGVFGEVVWNCEEHSHIGETLEPPAGVPHTKPQYNPDVCLGLGVDYSSLNYYEGISLDEIRDVIHVYYLYRGHAPVEIVNYGLDFKTENDTLYLVVTDDGHDWWCDEKYLYENNNIGLNVLRSFLPEVNLNNPLEIVAGAIGGMFYVYTTNEDILQNAIQVEDIENGKEISICLSDSTLVDSDLLALVNRFVDFPGENGPVDINAQTLYYFLSEVLGAETFAEIDGALQMVGGFTLEDLCTDLYLNLTGYLNNNNKLRFGLSFSGADNDPDVDETYLSIGIIEYHAVVTDSAYDANLTPEELSAANPLDEIVDVLFGCFAGLMNMGGDLD